MYRMLDVPATPLATLERAYAIGKEAGLRYVYVGNTEDDAHHDTRCPKCAALCVQRGPYYSGLDVKLKITGAVGACPSCGEKIAGVWKT